MANYIALAVALVALAAVCNAQLVTLTADEKQAILDAHNALRSRVAQGLIANQPKAANMPVLEWDDRLMDSAGNWVKQCIAGHDSGRTLPGYSWIGQNWAAGGYTNYSYYVELWFNEYKDYTFDSNSCTKTCGHYTQVVWAKTTLVGCAVARCSNLQYTPITMVCNYATGGNYNGESPYVKGEENSKCVGDYAFKRRGLCVRKDQCPDCTCSIDACQNGGVLNADSCACTCPSGFFGEKCDKTCVDSTNPDHYCSFGDFVCGYPSYAVNCPKACNLCKPVVLRDSNVINRDNVKARSP